MKYIDFTGIPISWTKIATNTFNIGYPGSTDRPYCCIVNGYFTMVYCCSSGGNPKTSRGFCAISWDKNGNQCRYQTTDLNTAATDNYGCENTLVQSGNTFQYALLGGGTWRVVIPPIFTPGATYYLPPTPLNVTNPCRGGAPDQTIFLSNQNLVAYEWIQDFPESSNYWASIYDRFGSFLYGGYIGNAFQNLFNRISTSLPPFVFDADLYYRNGQNTYGTFGNAGSTSQVIGFNTPYLFGPVGDLVCGGAGNPNVYVDSINQIQVYPYRDLGGPLFQAGSYQQRMGITNLPNYQLFPDSGNVFYLWSRDFIFGFRAMPFGSGAGNAVAYLADQNLLMGQVSDVSHYFGDIYVAQFPQVNVAPLPIITTQAHNGLVNMHRAVSPFGAFKT